MSLRNALGDLALDETLKQMIAKFRDWQDPTWVASHPDIPVHVDGKVAIKQDPAIVGRLTVWSPTGVAGQILPGNSGRTGLSFFNSTIAGPVYVLATNAPNQSAVSVNYHTITMNIGDYWELPDGANGVYKGPIYANTGFAGLMMITEYSN